jgi:UDPglucose 6-dehydrogenase
LFYLFLNLIRESPAIYVSKYLLDEGAHLYIYDPQVEENQVMYELSNSQLNLPIDVVKKQVHVVRDPIEACKDSHAVVILTEWDEFKVISVCFFILLNTKFFKFL